MGFQLALAGISSMPSVALEVEESEGIEREFISSSDPISEDQLQKNRDRRLKRELKTLDKRFAFQKKMEAQARAAMPPPATEEEALERARLFEYTDQSDAQSHSRVRESIRNRRRVTVVNPSESELDAAHEELKDHIRDGQRRLTELLNESCANTGLTADLIPLDQILGEFDKIHESSKRMSQSNKNVESEMTDYMKAGEEAIQEALKGVDVEKDPARAEQLASDAMQKHFQENFRKLPGVAAHIEEMERLGLDPDQSLQFGTPDRPFAFDRHEESIDVLDATNHGYRVQGTQKDEVARGFSGVYASPEEMIADESDKIAGLRAEGNDEMADQMEDGMRDRARGWAAQKIVWERNGKEPPALITKLLVSTEKELGEKIEPTEADIAKVKFAPPAASKTRSIHPIEKNAIQWGVPVIPEDIAKKYGYAP